MQLILASTSPRRRELLARLGIGFHVAASNVEERDLVAGETAVDLAVALALQKARAVASDHPGSTVLGADTVVFLDGRSLAKPEDAAHAAEMLRLLRGKTHTVTTGLAAICSGIERTGAVTARVSMRNYPDAEIEGYVATGEPMDKAGAYAVQGKGGALVESVDGCYLTVVGLPLCCAAELLAGCGFDVRPPAESWCRH